MTVASFKIARHALSLSLGLVCAVGSIFACVESDGAPSGEDGGPSDSAILPDATKGDAATPDDASPLPEVGNCSDSGFCRVPIPVLEPLVSVSATSIDDAWAISRNAILRWDGTSWKTMHRSPGAEFFGLVMVKPDDVWVLGLGLVVRYSARDGGAASIREYPGGIRTRAEESTGFWVSPTSDQLWIVTDSYRGPPEILRYREELAEAGDALIEDTMTTAAMGFPWPAADEDFTVCSVFGFGPKDVYAGGLWCTGTDCEGGSDQERYGAIAHYDGERWTKVAELGKGERVSAIYGHANPDQSRRLWIWSGLGGYPGNSIRMLPATREGSVGSAEYSLPVRIDNGAFSTLESFGQGCHRVIGSIPNATKAWFSDICLVYRWNGTKLDLTPTAIGGLPMGSVTGIWADESDKAWLVGAAPSPVPDTPPIGFAAIRRSAP